MNCPLKLNSYHKNYNIFKQCLITNNYTRYYTKQKSHINGEHLYAHIFYNRYSNLFKYVFSQKYIIFNFSVPLKKNICDSTTVLFFSFFIFL